MHPHQPAPRGNFPLWASWQEAEHLPIMEAKPGVVSQQPLQQKHRHTCVWPARDTTWAWYPKKLKCGESRPAGGTATSTSKAVTVTPMMAPAAQGQHQCEQPGPSTLVGLLCVLWPDSSCQSLSLFFLFSKAVSPAREHFCDALTSF